MNKTARIAVRLTAAEHQAAIALAKLRGLPLSRIVRNGLLAAVKASLCTCKPGLPICTYCANQHHHS